MVCFSRSLVACDDRARGRLSNAKTVPNDLFYALHIQISRRQAGREKAYFPVPVSSFKSTSWPDKIDEMNSDWESVGFLTEGKALERASDMRGGTPIS